MRLQTSKIIVGIDQIIRFYSCLFNKQASFCNVKARLFSDGNVVHFVAGTGDCIIEATKSHCKNAVSVRKRKKCYIDFLPLVFAIGDTTKTQKLSCQDRLFGFDKCRPISITSPQQCANSPRCVNVPRNPHKMCMSTKCDFGVLVSGGWSPLTAHPRHANNLKNFYQFLRDNKFKKDHITTFYGSDGNIQRKYNFYCYFIFVFRALPYVFIVQEC